MVDFVSLGGSCAVAYHLRQNIENFSRMPFDWVKITIQQLNEVLKTDFDSRYTDLVIKKFSENHPFIDDHGKIDDNQGSFILVNSLKIQFAHQIVEKGGVETFIPLLKQRINSFRNLSGGDGENGDDDGDDGEEGQIKFVRLETSRIGKNYLTDLELLCQNLRKYSGSRSISLILIVHAESLSLFDKYNDKEGNKYINGCKVILYTFPEFDSDWKYPEIDWSGIFSHK
jgi:hypothetical protein